MDQQTEKYFSLSKGQLQTLASVKDLELNAIEDVLPAISIWKQFVNFFSIVYSLILWIISLALSNDEELILCTLQKKPNLLEGDPNQDFLQPKGSRRYLLRPIQFPELYWYTQTLDENPWKLSSADFDSGNDRKEFAEIIKKEPGIKDIVWNVLGYFATADGIVLENLQVNFGEEAAIPEARAWWATQEKNEVLHQDVYGILLENYVASVEDRKKLFDSMETMPAIRKKARWAQFWLDKRHSFAERLVAYSAIEGIHFASSFSLIYWLKSRFPNKMTGLTKSNEWISKDENLHVEFAINFHNMLPSRVSLERIKEIYLSAVAAELAYVRAAIPKSGVQGLDTRRVEEHVRYMGNFWFEMFQDPRKPVELLIFNPDGSTPRPMDEVRSISRASKVNFFEVRNSNYSEPDLSNQSVILSGKF
jgi:ribonucleotide reductase beta subunit family protein with ferritin-like domain